MGVIGMSEEEKRILLVVLGIAVGAFLVMLVLKAIVCWLLFRALKRVPPVYRKQNPKLIWLLLIPFFDVVWNFFVIPKISESYRAYFAAQDNVPIPQSAVLNYQSASLRLDTGRGVGMAYCICYIFWGFPCFGIVPFIGSCMFIGLSAALLVLIILYLVRLNVLKAQMPPVLP